MAVRSGLNVRTYSKLISNGLVDLKVAIYACPNHTDDGIHSDHGYLDTWDNPLGPAYWVATLIPCDSIHISAKIQNHSWIYYVSSLTDRDCQNFNKYR